jgi:hypothetical protein
MPSHARLELGGGGATSVGAAALSSCGAVGSAPPFSAALNAAVEVGAGTTGSWRAAWAGVWAGAVARVIGVPQAAITMPSTPHQAMREMALERARGIRHIGRV